MLRKPAVAGPFYSASAATLAADVAGCMDGSAQPKPRIAVISPHAGLMYSGPVAGSV
jgi:AmmeMemoRadiSam system protein B